MPKVVAVMLRERKLFGTLRLPGDPITEDEYNALDINVQTALVSGMDIKLLSPGEVADQGSRITNLEERVDELEAVVRSLKEVIENPVGQES